MATKLTLNLRSLKEDLAIHLHGSFTLNKKIDREMIGPVTATTQRIVEQTFEAAVQNVKEVLKGGVGDADSPLNAIGIVTGGGATAGLHLRPGWSPLSAKYARHKEKTGLGAGVFHKYRGHMYRSYAGMRTPAVSATHDTKETSPGKGRKREISFRVKVTAGHMSFPLDELVRRPLLLGRKGLVDPSDVAGTGTDMQQRLLGLESGILRTSSTGTDASQPPRPFLNAMSIKLNSRMRQRILQQDSKE